VHRECGADRRQDPRLSGPDGPSPNATVRRAEVSSFVPRSVSIMRYRGRRCAFLPACGDCRRTSREPQGGREDAAAAECHCTYGTGYLVLPCANTVTYRGRRCALLPVLGDRRCTFAVLQGRQAPAGVMQRWPNAIVFAHGSTKYPVPHMRWHSGSRASRPFP